MFLAEVISYNNQCLLFSICNKSLELEVTVAVLTEELQYLQHYLSRTSALAYLCCKKTMAYLYPRPCRHSECQCDAMSCQSTSFLRHLFKIPADFVFTINYLLDWKEKLRICGTTSFPQCELFQQHSEFLIFKSHTGSLITFTIQSCLLKWEFSGEELSPQTIQTGLLCCVVSFWVECWQQWYFILISWN